MASQKDAFLYIDHLSQLRRLRPEVTMRHARPLFLLFACLARNVHPPKRPPPRECAKVAHTMTLGATCSKRCESS